MSYTRKYRERITIRYSGSVSYPASQNGGSMSYSGSVSEDVNVCIDVDTRPFDAGVANCNSSVNMLTGSVVATQAAQIASIDQNAKKVGSTIVEGFFKTIRSEISQQIMELSQRIDANLMHLRELAKSCIAKQKQMEADYSRTSIRYLKIFEDLNKELENRIFELNKPAFVFKKETDNHAIRTTANDLVSTVAVFGREGSELQAKISASIAKKRALDTINQANVYLWKQKKLENTITQSMLNENITASKFALVCFVETQNEKSQIGKNVYQSAILSHVNSNEIIENFKNKNWANTTKEQKENIQRYFNMEVNNEYSSSNLHNNRVKETIAKIFDLNSVKSI